jgi:hypothetical protein
MSAAIDTLVTGWRRFWFTPESGLSLGLCRILFFGGLGQLARGLETAQWAEIDALFWFPIPLFRALGLTPPGAPLLEALVVVYRLALASACLGLFTRTSMAVAFGAGCYAFALPQNFGKVHHSDAMLLFVMAAFALSRAGDRLSLDVLIGRLRGAGRAPAVGAASGEYRWPVRFGQVAWVLVYFAAGTAKLRTSGLEWIDAGAFRNLLLSHHYTHAPKVDWGLAIAATPWLCSALAALTILFEVGAPLALVHARLRALIVPALIAMQLGIYLVLGVSFRPFLLLLPFWVPWDRLARYARRGRAADVAPVA